MAGMAEIDVDRDELIVRLRPLEKIGAFGGDVRVPRSAVRDVRVAPRPFSELRGLRAPGTGCPRVIALGTWRRGRGRKDFAAIYRRREAVVVELDEQVAGYGRLVVSVDDAAATVGRLTGLG